MEAVLYGYTRDYTGVLEIYYTGTLEPYYTGTLEIIHFIKTKSAFTISLTFVHLLWH